MALAVKNGTHRRRPRSRTRRIGPCDLARDRHRQRHPRCVDTGDYVTVMLRNLTGATDIRVDFAHVLAMDFPS